MQWSLGLICSRQFGYGPHPHSTYNKDSHLMHLVHILVFLAVQFDFWFVAEHVESKANSLADDLSHDNFLISFLKFRKQSTTNLLKFCHNSWTFWDTTITFGHLQNGSSCSGILYNSSDSSDTQNL